MTVYAPARQRCSNGRFVRILRRETDRFNRSGIGTVLPIVIRGDGAFPMDRVAPGGIFERVTHAPRDERWADRSQDHGGLNSFPAK